MQIEIDFEVFKTLTAMRASGAEQCLASQSPLRT
jgi:hypothetical protein